MEEVAAFVIQILIEVGVQFLGGLGFDLATTRRRADGTTEDGYSGPVLFGLVRFAYARR